jgi:hypothetical protein
MKRPPSVKTIVFLVAIPPILAVATVFYASSHFKNKDQAIVAIPAVKSIHTPLTIPSPTVSPQFQPVVEVSPSPGSIPVGTPTPTPSPAPASLPQSARAFVDLFYGAYARKDKDGLGTFFTMDSTDELRLLHSHLFLGVDLQGLPGGPTLFSTNAASQWASGASIISATPQGDTGWLVSVQEKRMGANGSAIGSVSAAISLVPGIHAGDWRIAGYSRVGLSGKYEGFLIE